MVVCITWHLCETSCPALCRPSTSFWRPVKTWMAGRPARRRSSRFYPAMTTKTFASSRPGSACSGEPYIATDNAIATTLAPAILRQPVERLGKPLQRERIRGLGALCRHPLDDHIGGLAHGVDHPLFLGGVLDPEAVALGVHRVGSAADLKRRFRARLQGVADYDRDFVGDFLRRTGGDEGVGWIARTIRRIGFRGRGFCERKAGLLAVRRRGIGPPGAELPDQRRLRASGNSGLGFRLGHRSPRRSLCRLWRRRGL